MRVEASYGQEYVLSCVFLGGVNMSVFGIIYIVSFAFDVLLVREILWIYSLKWACL